MFCRLGGTQRRNMAPPGVPMPGWSCGFTKTIVPGPGQPNREGVAGVATWSADMLETMPWLKGKWWKTGIGNLHIYRKKKIKKSTLKQNCWQLMKTRRNHESSPWHQRRRHVARKTRSCHFDFVICCSDTICGTVRIPTGTASCTSHWSLRSSETGQTLQRNALSAIGKKNMPLRVGQVRNCPKMSQ